jgi:spore maturation protein CgeB
MTKPDGDHLFPDDQVVDVVGEFVQASAYRWWPHVVVVVQGTFVRHDTLDLFRSRGHKVVVIHTESPYEDVRQLDLATHADVNLLNDPINLDRFLEVNPNTWYQPHAYDPMVHKVAPPVPGEESEVVFIGTGYPSRELWLEAVDWTGIDLALGGNWRNLPPDSQLRKYVAHDIERCLDNDDTAVAYRSAQMGFNLYRTEAQDEALCRGWAVGPREVEMAACGLFFVREARAEGDDLFPMLPTFETPGELESLIREWLPRSDDRARLAAEARAQIANRTFANHARQLLTRI